MVPPRARALGIPAEVTEDVVAFEQWVEGVEVYVSRARLYRDTLRVVDSGGVG